VTEPTVASTDIANDVLTFTVVQTGADGKTLSKLVLEYPNLPNAEANMIQLAYISALIEAAGKLADAKAAAGGK